MSLFLVYSSSAGSGKTYTLTREFLKLALTGPVENDDASNFIPYYYKHILAVTFTNDAAQEMKSRILNYLQEFSQNSAHPMIQDILSDKPELKSAQEIVKRSKLILQHLLHHYSEFNISTIDSFNNRIIQAFKRELDLPQAFELELNQTQILDTAVERLIEKISPKEQQELTAFFESYLLDNISEDSSWNLANQIKSFGNILFKERKDDLVNSLRPYALADIKTIRKELKRKLDEIDAKYRQLSQQALDIILNAGLSIDQFTQKKRGIAGFLTKGIDPKNDFVDLKANSYAEKAIGSDAWTSTKKGNEAVIALIDGVKPQLTDIYYQLQELIEVDKPNFVIFKNILKNFYQLGILLELNNSVKDVLTEQNVVHISEFNQKINEVVKNEPIPFIYEKLGDRFHHILIDEFQDTSVLQWINMIPLITNALAKGGLSLLVGDTKQAIYRWRSGDARLLADLPNIPSGNEDTSHEDQIAIAEFHNPQILSDNYRTQKNIVEFNNAFFEKYILQLVDFKDPIIEKQYSDVYQNPKKAEEGSVKITLFTDPIRKTTFFKDAFGQEILAQINYLQTKGIPFGEMCILTRKNAEVVEYASLLLEHNIPVISSEALRVNASPSVNFIMALFYILNGNKNEGLYNALLSFIRKNYTEHSNFDWNTVKKSLKESDYDKSKPLNFLKTHVPDFEWDLLENYGSLGELVILIAQVFNLSQFKNEIPYQHFLMDKVIDFAARYGQQLDLFLDQWENLSHNWFVHSGGSQEAVNIMTVHKSKGLEFDYLFLPLHGNSWAFVPDHKTTLWTNWTVTEELPPLKVPLTYGKNLQEAIYKVKQDEITAILEEEILLTRLDTLNLLYVAQTRPVKHLHILSHYENSSDKISGVISNLVTSEIITSKFTKKESSLTIEDHLHGTFNKVEYSLGNITGSKAIVKETVPTLQPLTPKKPSPLKINWIEEKSSPELTDANRTYGKMIHFALQWIQEAKDIPFATNKLHTEGHLTYTQSLQLQDHLTNIIALPDISEYYQGKPYKVFTEWEIFLQTKQGKWQKNIIDRLMIHGDHAVVIDYKTGLQGKEKDIKQVKNYCSQLNKLGYATVKGFIVYTEHLETFQVV